MKKLIAFLITIFLLFNFISFNKIEIYVSLNAKDNSIFPQMVFDVKQFKENIFNLLKKNPDFLSFSTTFALADVTSDGMPELFVSDISDNYDTVFYVYDLTTPMPENIGSVFCQRAEFRNYINTETGKTLCTTIRSNDVLYIENSTSTDVMMEQQTNEVLVCDVKISNKYYKKIITKSAFETYIIADTETDDVKDIYFYLSKYIDSNLPKSKILERINAMEDINREDFVKVTFEEYLGKFIEYYENYEEVKLPYAAISPYDTIYNDKFDNIDMISELIEAYIESCRQFSQIQSEYYTYKFIPETTVREKNKFPLDKGDFVNSARTVINLYTVGDFIFTFVDIDFDGIPEVFVDRPGEKVTSSVFMYYDNTAFYVYFIPRIKGELAYKYNYLDYYNLRIKKNTEGEKHTYLNYTYGLDDTIIEKGICMVEIIDDSDEKNLEFIRTAYYIENNSEKKETEYFLLNEKTGKYYTTDKKTYEKFINNFNNSDFIDYISTEVECDLHSTGSEYKFDIENEDDITLVSNEREKLYDALFEYIFSYEH